MKFTTILPSAAALLAFASQATALDWTNCAPPMAQVPDATFKMDGEWACVGQKVCGTLTGTFESPIIQNSKLIITVKYLGRTTNTMSRDFCTVLAESGYNCPIPAGPKTLHACIDYNGNTLNINTTTSVQVNNGDNRILFCQTSTVMNKDCTIYPNP